jgi:tetratricopeptide (TPR) repeat protein
MPRCSFALAPLLVAVTASADTRNPDLADGLRHLEHLRYAEARAAFKKALESEGNARTDMVAIYSNLGVCAAAEGDPAAAAEAFDRLLSIEPSFEVGADASPKLRVPFEEARARAKTRSPLKLAHVPPQAQAGEPLVISLKIVSDPLQLISRVYAQYRFAGESEYQKSLHKAEPEMAFQLPRDLTVQAKAGQRLEYFLEATDSHAGVVGLVGRPDSPLVLTFGSAPVVEAPRSHEEAAVERSIEEPSQWKDTVRPVALVLGLSSLGGAAAGLIVGATASGKASDLKEKLATATTDSNGALTTIGRPEALKLEAEARARAQLANIILAASGAGFAVSAVLFLVSREDAGSGGDAPALRLSAAPGSVWLSGDF